MASSFQGQGRDDGPSNSKMQRDTTFCVLCEEEINQTNGPRHHVLHKHLKKPLATCSVCSFGSAFPGNIQRHIRVVHQGVGEVRVTAKEEYAEEEADLWDQCYGHGETARMKREKKAAAPTIKRDTSFCMVCQKNIVTRNGPRFHILRKHLKKPLESCSICSYADCSAYGRLKAHIATVHGGVGEVVKTPKKEYELEEKTWWEMCYAPIGTNQEAKSFQAVRKAQKREYPQMLQQYPSSMHLMEPLLKMTSFYQL